MLKPSQLPRLCAESPVHVSRFIWSPARRLGRVWRGTGQRPQSQLYWLLSKLVFTEKSYEHSFSLWRWYLPSSLCLSVCLESTIHSPSLQLFMQSVFSSPSCLPFSVSLYGGAYLCMSVFYAKIGLNVPISNYNLF